MPDIKSWLYFNRSISLGHAGLHCGSHRRVYIAYVDLTTGYIVFSPIEEVDRVSPVMACLEAV